MYTSIYKKAQLDIKSMLGSYLQSKYQTDIFLYLAKQ